MIRGVINSKREAIVRLRLRGPSGAEVELEAILDTGYNGALTVSPSIANSLALPWKSGGKAAMADGSTKEFDVYIAEIEWCGKWLSTPVSAIGHEPLLGMRLLMGSKLQIDVVLGGTVEITPLP